MLPTLTLDSYQDYLYLQSIITLQRIFKLYLSRKYLENILSNLPTLSPIDNRWPTCLDSFNEINEKLKRIFHKWRCFKYRKKLDHIDRNKMHEKAIASTLFKDKKESYNKSIPHAFCGDYVKLRQNPKWLKMSHETYDHYIVFADIIYKINRSDGNYVQKLLVITTKGLLIIDHRTLEAKYIIPAFLIQQICLSPFTDGLIGFNLKADKLHKGDFMIFTNHAIEVTAKLYLVILNVSNNTTPKVLIDTKFQLNTYNNNILLINIDSQRSPYDENFAQLPKISKKGTKLSITI